MSAMRPSGRRRPPTRRRSPLLRALLLVAAAAVVFVLGVGLGQALRDGPDAGGERTYERTLDPESLPPPPETVTVTVTVTAR